MNGICLGTTIMPHLGEPFNERRLIMALTDGDGNGMVMPVAPMYGGGNGGGFGWGNDLSWIILLLLCGWGGGFGFGGGMGGFAADGAALYPWMNQAEITSDGFRDQMMNNNITSIRDAVSGISTQLCNGFAGVNAGVANGFAQAEIAANGRQMADMNQRFALQSQLADCCCENRLGLADLKYTVATENCADRAAVESGIRDVITNNTANTQAILDKLCQLELDGVKGQLAQAERENIGLQNQLNMAVMQNGMNAEVDALYNRLKNCPVPTTPVYGTTPIFTCGGNNAGCGCGSF